MHHHAIFNPFQTARRTNWVAGFLAIVLWLVSIPAQAVQLYAEGYDTFSCGGSWAQFPETANYQGYKRDCGSGYTALITPFYLNIETISPYEFDTASTSPAISTANYLVETDGTSGQPAVPALYLHTINNETRATMLWLLKSYTVEAGKHTDIGVNFRFKLDADMTLARYGVRAYVFDGAVTDPAEGHVLGSQRIYSLSSAWSAWRTVTFTDLVPQSGQITVAFVTERKGRDVDAQFDNLTIDQTDATTTPSAPEAGGDLNLIWVGRHDQGNASMAAEGTVDVVGNSYVVGRADNGSNYDVSVVKFDTDGNRLWSQSYDGGSSDQGTAIAVDGSGNVYAAGKGYNGSDWDIVAVKYDASGVLQWSRSYDNGGNDDESVDLGVDGSGNVFITGRSCSVSLVCDFVTLRYDATNNTSGTGQEAWVTSYDNGDNDEPAALVINGTGDVYVTGKSRRTTSAYDIYTVKYNPATGAAVQAQRHTSSTNDAPAAMVLDGSGNVIVTGQQHTATGYDYLTLKYDGNLSAETWAAGYDSGATDMASAVAVDGSGNVIVIGKSGTTFAYDYATVKYDTSGVQQWYQTYDGGNNDEALSVGTDSSGNIYVTGRSNNGSDDDIATVKYDAAGTQVQDFVYDQNVGDDVPTTIMVASDDTYGPTGYIFATVKNSDGASVNSGMAALKYGVLFPDLTTIDVSGPVNVLRGATIALDADIGNISDITTRAFANSGPFDVGVTIAPSVPATPVSIATDDFSTFACSATGPSSWAQLDYPPTQFLLECADAWTGYMTASTIKLDNPPVVDSSGGTAATFDSSSDAFDGTGYFVRSFAVPALAADTVAVALNASIDVSVTWGCADIQIYAGAVRTLDGLTPLATGNQFCKTGGGSAVTGQSTVADVLLPPGTTAFTVALRADSRNISLFGYQVATASFDNLDVSLTTAAMDPASCTGTPHNPTNCSAWVDAGTLGSINNVAPGGSSTLNSNLTLPYVPLSVGNYVLMPEADNGGAVTETDETNNRTNGYVITIGDKPDLQATSVAPTTSSLPAGQNLTVNYTIDNPNDPDAGTPGSPSFDVKFYRSSDTTIGNGDDFLLSTVRLDGIAGGGSFSSSEVLTIDASTPAGDYYITMVGDTASEIDELSETNNNQLSSAFTVQAIPDLVVTTLSAPLGASQGQQITVTNTVKNNADGNSGPFDVGIYLSTDATVTTGDTLLASRTVSAGLSGNQTSSDNTAVTIPSTVSGGYYLGVIADSGDVIVEGNETNNTAVQSLSIEPVFDTGDATDGAATLAGTVDLSSQNVGADSDDNGASADGFSTLLTADASTGATTVTVSDTSGFVSGDEVLIIQLIHDTNHGAYEFLKNVTVVNGTTLSLAQGVVNNYYATGTTAKGTANTVQVVRVPHYSTLNIAVGTTLTTSAFNISSRLGGILAFRATSVTVDGAIQADALGFAGGPGYTLSGGGLRYGGQGDSYTGAGSPGDASSATGNNGGGGGGGATNAAAGGAGGGYGAAGTSNTSSTGGIAYGDADLSTLHLGSGGGGGSGRNASGGMNFTAGTGGTGGGIIFVSVGTLTVNTGGVISGNGGGGGSGTKNNTTSTTYSGGGGGGSGGSVLIEASTSTLSGSITAAAGTAGTGANGGSTTTGADGKPGAVGRTSLVIAQPDLIVSDVSGPTSAARGDTIAVSTTVENVLSAAVSSSFKVGIYLSTDSTITTGDTNIGECTLTGLAGNTSSILTTGSSPECGNATIPLTLYSTYAYRKAVTIAAAQVSGSGNLANFPVLVSVTDPDLRTVANGGRVENANGYDNIFRAADGTTALDFEVETYDATTGELVAWVRVPTLSGSVDTLLYLYYGSSGITTSQENPTAVWNTDYEMVQHLDEISGSHVDSTANGNDGTPQNGVNQNAIGKIGGADHFDGVNDYVSMATLLDSAPAQVAVSLWFRLDNPFSSANTVNQTLIGKENIVGQDRLWMNLNQPDGTLRVFGEYNNGGNWVINSDQNSWAANTWYHVALTYDGTWRMYINGVLQASTTTVGGLMQNGTGTDFLVGTNSSVSNVFEGIIDQVAVSSIARSADWIATEYANMNSPSTFYSVGTEEAAPPPSAPTYYLGAIVDYQSAVTELNETNNATVQTVSGSPQGTTVSVSLGGASNLQAASSNSGGGAFGIIELLLMLLGGGISAVTRCLRPGTTTG